MTSQWILTLETSVTHATLLLARDGLIFAQSSFTSERSQECDLYPPLLELLSHLPSGERLSHIIIGTGPGSYNGTRVGIATAQAIAQVHHCRLAGLCSFEATSESVLEESTWAIGDARRGSYFLIPLHQGRCQEAPRLLDEKELLQTLEKKPGVSITFEPPERLPAGISCTQSHPTAEGLLKAWLKRSDTEKETLLNSPTETLYIRPPHITKSKKKPLLRKP